MTSGNSSAASCSATQLSWGRRLQFVKRTMSAFWRSARGVAMVEFAVAAPFLVLLLLPLVDLGMGFYAKTQIMTAAEAGTQYAFVHGWSGASGTTQTAILSAVSSATSITGMQTTPAPVLACGCADGTTITYSSPNGSFTQNSCSGLAACANGQKPGAYVTVSTQVSYTPLFGYWIFGPSNTLTAGSTVRIQ